MIKKQSPLTVALIVVIIILGVLLIKNIEDKNTVIKTNETLQSEIETLNSKIEIQDEDISNKEIEIEGLQSKNDELQQIAKYFIGRPQLEGETNENEIKSSDFWLEYETKLFESKSLSEVIGLYYTSLDGAASEGYSAIVYYYYQELGAKEFVKQLSENCQRYNVGGILYHLTAEMDLYYSNDGDIDLEEIEMDFKNLDNEGLSNRERNILYRVLADIEDIK